MKHQASLAIVAALIASAPACSKSDSGELGGGADNNQSMDMASTSDATNEPDFSVDGAMPDARVGDVDPTDMAEPVGLYQGAGPYDVSMAGRMALQPDHRLGPTMLDPSEHSNLPLTVSIPDGAPEPLPVVIYSHGGGSRQNPGESGASWTAQIAPGGYAVIAMHHMARSMNDMVANICGPRNVDPTDCDPDIWVPVYESTDRPQDAVAVVDSLAAIEAEFGIVLDQTRVAVLGHSGGTNSPIYMAGGRRNAAPPNAPIVVEAEFADPRPIAFVTSSPPGGDGAGWFATELGQITRPVFSVTGAGDIDPELRATLFDDLADGNKYRLFLNSTALDHGAYNMTGSQTAEGLREQLFAIIAATTLAFLDAHVRDDANARAWLDSDAPGILTAELVDEGPVPHWSTK